MLKIGQEVICIHPGSTLLVKDRRYKVIDTLVGEGAELYEFDLCPGMLFGAWRFRVVGESEQENNYES